MNDNQYDSSKTINVAVIDIFSEGLSVIVAEHLAPEDFPSFSLGQELDHNALSRKGFSSKFLPGCAAEKFEQFAAQVLLHEDSNSADSWTIILGAKSDPFIPFQGKFDSALRVIETMAALRPSMLFIQTRSPLIVLALPVLKSLGNAVCVTVALETVDETEAVRLTPSLPRPNERIKTARTLKNFGIRTLIQLAPTSSSSIKKLAATAVEIADHIIVCPESENRIDGRMASCTLNNLLQWKNPEKLISVLPDIWRSRVETEESRSLTKRA